MARAALLHGWKSVPDVFIPRGWTVILIFIVIAPLVASVTGYGLMVAISGIRQKKSPRNVNSVFRRLQLLSAAAYSLGHGGNDAQKTMGIVAGALYAAGVMTARDFAEDWGHWHWPIIFVAYTAIALGTYVGGRRIVHTRDLKIPKLQLVGGF